MTHFRYRDRHEGGTILAESLAEFADDAATIVLALPRGGVPVGYEVAVHLHVPLDAYVVRKLGVPGHEELAMGALSGDGTYVIDRSLVAAAHVSAAALEAVIERELTELRRRQEAYRDGRDRRQLAGKTIVLVDDGLATGSTMYVAVEAMRRREPAAIIVAAPVGAVATCDALRAVADRVVCAYVPDIFGAVGLFYEDFTQTSDDDVRRLIAHAARLEAQQWRAA